MTKVLHTADWHLGHNRTSTQHICNNIIRYIVPYISKIDIMFIAGDMFDKSLSVDSIEARLTLELLITLCQEAEKYGTKIRILKGTHLHDKYQLETLSTIFNGFPKLDAKYFNTMTYEQIEDLGISCYYIPDIDNLPYRSFDNILTKITSDLRMYNTDTVDYMIIHGTFEFCGIIAKHTPIVYNSNIIERFVTKHVLVGHIHPQMSKNKILYAGSFDRLSFAEEHNVKGFWYIENDIPTFVTNDNALIYTTIDLTSVPEKDIHKHIKNHIESHMVIGHIQMYLRCKLSKSSNLSNLKHSIRHYIQTTFPHVKVEFKILSTTEEDEQSTMLYSANDTKLSPLSTSTIVDMVYQDLYEKYPVITKSFVQQMLSKKDFLITHDIPMKE